MDISALTCARNAAIASPPSAAVGFGRHVQLLLDDPGPGGGEADDEGDDPEVPRRAEQGYRLATTHAALLDDEVGGCADRVAGADGPDDDDADDENGRRHEQEVVGSDLLDDGGRDLRTQGAAQARTGPDEPEEPLGLPGVIEIVGQRPELADEQDPQDQAGEVERHRGPHRAGPQEKREHDEQGDDAGLRDGNHKPAWESPDGAGVEVHQHADEDAGRQLHVRADCRRPARR